MEVLGHLIKFFEGTSRRPKEKRLTLVFVDYSTADRLLKLNKGWRIAKEEDRNKRLDKVYLEKTEPYENLG